MAFDQDRMRSEHAGRLTVIWLHKYKALHVQNWSRAQLPASMRKSNDHEDRFSA